MTASVRSRRTRTAATALALGLALAACTGAAPERPAPVADRPMPADWSMAPAVDALPWPATDWWRGFASDELDRLIETARLRNLDLAAAAARVRQADAQARIAGAPLLPTVDANTNARRSGPVERPGDASTPLSLSVGAAYELDFWGRNAAGLDAAEAALAASRFDRETVAITVTAGVAAAYFDVLSQRERLGIAQLNLEIAERVLELVETRVREGAASPLDLARQRAQVENQRAAIPVLESGLNAARVTLAILLGLPPQAFDVAAVGLDGLAAPLVGAGLPAELLARRPDIGRAEANLAAADANIQAARAAFFPQATLSASLASSAGNFAALLEPASMAYTLGANLVQAIFDGGRRQGQVALAEARRLELVHTYRAAVLAAFGDVERTLVDLDARHRQEERKAAELEQARLSYDLAEQRYRAGVEDLLALLDAQRTLYQAEDQYGQVRLARFQALVALYRALGGGWDGTFSQALTAPP